jgi:uncharacterized protein YjbJ (UPF0337 family)
MVNAQVLQGQWNQVRGELKKKWGQLTDDDLRFSGGNIDQLIGKIQQRTGEGREAIEQFLARHTDRINDGMDGIGFVSPQTPERLTPMVNAQALQGQWNQIRGELKKKWGQLTDDDLRFTNGNIDQLIGKIQQRTGEAREAIEQFLTEATSQGASAISQGPARSASMPAMPASR